MCYMAREHEFEVMFDNSVNLSIEDLGSVIYTDVVQQMIDYCSNIEIAPEVGYYIVDLVHASRNDPAIAMGGSPRASIALLRAARVLAASDAREHVYPDDVRAVLGPVMAHRLILNPEAILRGESVAAVIDRMTSSVKPPLSSRGRTEASVGV
jgi:MoxR-like ATPase